jgi:cytochrome c biogenesis protein ResB
MRKKRVNRRTNGRALRKKKIIRINNKAAEARARVLAFAQKRGSITCEQAKKVGRWDQGWYHLNILRRAGLLVHTKYNEWQPT